MRYADFKQLHSLLREIMEDEQRLYRDGCYSLIDDGSLVEIKKSKALQLAMFIESIEDSITRRAFKLRFVDGLSWQAVAIKMGYSSESGPRHLCDRYLNNT